MILETLENHRDSLEQKLALAKPWVNDGEYERENNDGFAEMECKREKQEDGSYLFRAKWIGHKSDLLTITYHFLQEAFPYLLHCYPHESVEYIEIFNALCPWPVTVIGYNHQKQAVVTRRHDAFHTAPIPPFERIDILPDGNMWSVLQGSNIQEGKAEFGKTVAEAMVNWLEKYGEPENPNVK